MRTCLALVLFVTTGLLSGRTVAAAEVTPLALVPRPAHVQRQPGTFTLKADTAILIDKDSADAANVGAQLAARLNRSTGFALKCMSGAGYDVAPTSIRLTTRGAKAELGPEGYTLKVTPSGVVISATSGPGLFYGMQTLVQLLPPQVFGDAKPDTTVAWTIPAVTIEDQPRFVWRGLMMDVSRHFFNKAEVKNFLDLMAQHKLNTFHWHLVDDNGWRIEIKRYPKLTEVGGWRKGIDFGLDPKAGTAYGPDGRYGGFFTQDDIREILAYAKARYITVVPEIEMPGHSGAALRAYPEFGCTGKPCGVYCAGNDETFVFLQNVLDEVLQLFPSKYIHIGGDEVNKGQWQRCAKCQARIAHEHLKNEHGLQSYFVRRIEKYLLEKKRILIGWDEILEGGLAPHATVMSWRGMGGGIAAVKSGHDAIMTPTSHCYFDYYQAQGGEPRAIGGFLPLAKVYAFEPVPAGISAELAKHILGTGGNLWAEYFPNYRHVQYMAYPRACAIAEVAWTPVAEKNWDDFSQRLGVHLQRLKAEGVNYRQPRDSDATKPAPKAKPKAKKKHA
jgi:hexosaminidase